MGTKEKMRSDAVGKNRRNAMIRVVARGGIETTDRGFLPAENALST
jgi:hypothetical protein